VSATINEPSGATAMPQGVSNSALEVEPSAYPSPAPATVLTCPVEVIHSNSIVVAVGDVDIVMRINSDSDWPIESRLSRWAIAVSRRAVSGHCRDCPLRRYLANAVVARIGDEEIAFRIERETRRRIECRLRARTIRIPFDTAGQSGYCSIRVSLRIRLLSPASAT